MKMLLLVLLFFALAVPTVQAQTEDSTIKGTRLAQQAATRSGGFKDVSVEGEMILRTRAGAASRRKFRLQSANDTGGATSKSLLVFDWPGDIRGTALLTHSFEGRPDDQWLFLPATNRVKRISSSGRSGAFVGSEFAFEDMVDQEVDKYTFDWVRDEPCPTINAICHVIDRFPKTRSGYSRQRIWLDKKRLNLQQTQYFDRRRALLKTLTIRGYKKYRGRIWRASSMTMVNHLTGKRTDLNWNNFKFDTGIPDREFRPNALKR